MNHVCLLWPSHVFPLQGPVLKRIPGLDPESAAVIWTMIDRHDLDSPWAAFWAALPAAFDTGLGVLEGRLQKALAGAPWLLQEAVQARQVRSEWHADGAHGAGAKLSCTSHAAAGGNRRRRWQVMNQRDG